MYPEARVWYKIKRCFASPDGNTKAPETESQGLRFKMLNTIRGFNIAQGARREVILEGAVLIGTVTEKITETTKQIG